MGKPIFEVGQEADGGFVAECLTEGIVTQADSRDELRHQAQEAVDAYCFDTDSPQEICLVSRR